jgi:hypothetical protein
VDSAFHNVIEEYIETIRLEGQKAISLATQRISTDLNKRFDQESQSMNARLQDQEHVISGLESEIESRKDQTSRLVRQLRSIANLAGKRGTYSGLWHPGYRLDDVLLTWLRKSKAQVHEEHNLRLASSFYICKLSSQIYHSWHLLAVTEQMGRLHSGELKAKEECMHRIALERDRAKEEVRRLSAQLETERGKRVEFLSQIKSTFNSKLDTLWTEN